ncbi:MAG: hypothetical protein A2234_10685 [Elusimicrobia bacterium RIFOXYA2_FULL_58_8]|nr:MAG: hypothetical protein A2234_10685 [Elusimicrobia bacterium RIFOXYA2_FULL_58_8]
MTLSSLTGPFRPEKMLKPVLIAALCFAAFWPTFKTGFMIDDPFMLRAVQAQPGLNMKGVVSDFTGNVHKEAGMFYYRPLLGLMVRLEYAAWGNDPRGYHAVSLAFHAANAVLLFYLLSALGFAPGVALAAACLFAVNPVIVDDLLAATGGESMANFFLLSILLLCLKDKWAVALPLAVPAMFAKESNVMLPALLLLCFAYQGRPRKDYVRILWLVPVCVLFLALRHRYVAAPPGVSVPDSLVFLFTVFPRVVAHYLAVLLAPVNLETWPQALTRAPYWGFALAGGGAAAAALFLLPVNRRVTAFCLCWFFLLLAPRVPAILATQVMMDKWVFMASPAVFVFLLTLLMKLREHHRPGIRAIPAAAAAATCFFWMTLAHAEVRLRGSDEKNYRWTIRSAPRSFASYRLGLILMQGGRAAQAVEVLRPLPGLYPDQPDYQNAFNMALWHSGRQAEAWELMTALEKKYPGNAPIRENAARMRELMTGAAFKSLKR